MKRKIFISYKRRLDAAAGADSEALADALKQLLDPEYEVFLDKAIPSGELWNGVISRNLASCDAAIALLSPAALTSQWVIHELSVLSNRARTADPPPCLLMAMVGGTGIADLAKPPFEAMGLKDIEAYVPAQAGAALAQNEYTDDPHLLASIANRLSVKLPPSRRSPRQKLINHIVVLLETFRNSIDELEGVLAVAPGPGDLAPRLARLADATLGASWEQLTEVIQILRADPNNTPTNGARDRMDRLIQLVFPSWVKAEAAATLALASATNNFPVLDAGNPWTFDQYVQRAEEAPDQNWRKVDVRLQGTEREDASFEQFVEIMCEKILTEGQVAKLRGLPSEAKLAQILDAHLKREVYFPIVSDEKDAERLLSQGRHWIRPILASSGQNLGQKGIVLLPPLTPDVEDSAYEAYGRLQKTAKR